MGESKLQWKPIIIERFEKLENRILKFCHLLSQSGYLKIRRRLDTDVLRLDNIYNTSSLSFLQGNTSIDKISL